MPNYYSEQVKGILKLYSMVKSHNIDDQNFIDLLKDNITTEGDILMYDSYDMLNQVFDFSFSFIDLPSSIIEDLMESYNYYIIAAIEIKDLIPYTSNPRFIDFTRAIEVVNHGYGYGNLIEMVYLPDSIIASEAGEEIKDLVTRPGTFMIGMQDNGGISLEDSIQFLLDLKTNNYYIMNLIYGNEERGEAS